MLLWHTMKELTTIKLDSSVKTTSAIAASHQYTTCSNSGEPCSTTGGGQSGKSRTTRGFYEGIKLEWFEFS